MNKQPIILTVMFLLLAALGVFYFYTQAQNQPVTDDRTNEILEESNIENEESDEVVVQEQEEPIAIELAKEAPEGALVYNIESGVAGYVAQKRFFQEEDAVVVGTTNDINGAGWFNPSDNSIYLEVNFDFADIASDSAQRDSGVLDLLSDTSVSFMVDESVLTGISVGEDFNTTVPGTLTVNNVTKEVEFDVSGTLSESGLNATGTTDALISDFGMEPPSLINVFTVDDPIELKFEVIATSINAPETMEEAQ